ncbi:phage minor head protein [Parvibaculum sp.]|uniref:phage minor head protein n=1 Tax=Parvibaculum sp. TaxID=2024848 RepID=UPI001D9C6523|nr:phage minor head protein [Parvibaculum sp.]MBX3490894.1 minor capsid protein [Parvibaculum sp.]
MAVNDTIADLQIRHQIGVWRLSSGVIQKLLPILDRADNEIVAKMLARPAALEGSFTSKRLAALLDTIREINHEAHVVAGATMRSELRSIARYEAGFQKSLLESAIPIKWDIVSPSREMLDAVVTSRPFQGRLLREWVSELDGNKARRLRDAIRQGVVQGETIPQIVRRVRGTKALNYRDGIMEIGRRGAEAMVRTAVAHTTSAARDTLYEANSDIIKAEFWVDTLDTRTCPSCRSLSGKEFEIGKGPKTPLHIFCRCVRAPVLKSWKELGFDIDELDPGTRASMNGQVPATLNYNSWLKKQPAAIQDEALGPTRGKLFRKGGLDVESFTSRQGDQLNLDELRAREAGAFAKAGLAA